MRSQGFSLVELLVTLGVMGIVMVAFMTMQSNQMKTTKGLSEKLAALSLEKTLITALADGRVCHFLFTSPASVGLQPATGQFDATVLPLRSAFSLNQIPALPSAGAGTVAKVDEAASPSAGSLKVRGLKMNILTAASANQFTAELVVLFNSPPETAFDLMPLVFPLQLQATGAAALKTVTGCQLAGGQGTSNYLAKWVTETSLGTSGLYQDPATGKLGLGTTTPQAALDVRGEVKLAASGEACTSQNEGALRYNPSVKQMEFCNGTLWGSLGGSGQVQAAASCVNFVNNVWDSAGHVFGGASCAGWTPGNIPNQGIAQVSCPSGTTKVVIGWMTNNWTGGESAVCLKP